jgi:hypothetical protein
MSDMMTAAEMRDFIKTHFTRTAFRWEQLPAYEVASDGSDYGRYLAGEPGPTLARKQPWLDRLASEKARGLHRHRVRFLHNPLHDYERYECEWGYVPNAAAGEDIRVLRLGEHGLPPELPDHDFWLLDNTHPLRMHYGPTGEFVGATVEHAMIDTYRRCRDTTWKLGEDFSRWWNRHPDLHRDADRKVA